jgi:hypothetical protein
MVCNLVSVVRIYGASDLIIHGTRCRPKRDDCKTRDEGRSLDYDAKERNAASIRFGRNPSGQGFAGGLPCCAPCITSRKAIVATMQD